MKKSTAKTSSLAAALAGWLLLSLLNVFVMWALRDRARLVRDNDNERTLSTLFAEMRNYENYDDLGSVVESNSALKERINGIALYENNLLPAYRWGDVPPVFDEHILEGVNRNRFGRYTIPDRRGQSAKFVLHYGRMPPRDPMPAMPEPPQGMMRNRGLARGRYFYIDISHPEYWRTHTITAVLFPITEIAFLILVFYIRRLYLRNREYREKIEAQHNLVVLGTAAGTLAHEIKNPLLSIRLQTGILEKTAGENGRDEINIINQEVDRLSSLVYRVNDYLREPAGEPVPFNVSRLLGETFRRVCGSDIPVSDDSSRAVIFADENRIRSVLENILRNAAESGGEASEIGASVNIEKIAHNGGSHGAENVVIRIFDRGRGIPEQDLKRVFDPFFTSKSTGTGIGLAVSKRFTEAAGGSITIENRAAEDGRGGLLVTLIFPPHSGEQK